MKFEIFGDYVIEFIVITILMVLSLILVIPFVPIFVGIVGYFSKDIHSRRFKDIFINIKINWKTLISYTIFQLIIILVPSLNIYYFNNNIDKMNYIMLTLNYTTLIIGLYYLITSPTIIINMNVNFMQLLYNGLMLLFGNLKNSIISILIIILVVLLILYFPYILLLLLYFIPFISQKLMIENFYHLKAKVLGISEEELKNKLKEDN